MPLNRLFRTSAFRLTLLFAALLFLCVALLFGAIELYVSRTLEAGLQSAVNQRLSALVGANPIASPDLANAAQAVVEQSRGAYVLLEDPLGQRLAGNLPATPPVTGWVRLTASARGSGAPITILGRGLRLLDGGYLLVAQDATGIHQLQDAMARAFALGGGLALLFAMGAGFIVSRRILTRLAAVGRASQEIMQGDLSRRLPTRGTGDEFDQLVNGFNALLDRVSTLMDSVRQVSNDIAHDLRTPLARLRNRLEDARRATRTPAEYDVVIDRCIADTTAILETFAALVRIAQIEATAGDERFTDIQAVDLVKIVAELYQPLADERRQNLETEVTPFVLQGERELLIQMLGNLAENACRHSQPGAHICIGASQRDHGVILWVRDNGPGIPPAERGRVFERFYRLEASRTTPGSGIGLSLAAAIASRHGGRITLSDANPGLLAEVWLPGSAQALARRQPQTQTAEHGERQAGGGSTVFLSPDRNG